MTREEHREAYERHCVRAGEMKLTIHGLRRTDGDGVRDYARWVDMPRMFLSEYHDELTAASAHLALSMLLAEVDT